MRTIEPDVARAESDGPDDYAAIPDLAALLSTAESPVQALRLLNHVLTTLPIAISLYDASDDRFRILYLNPAIESFAGPVNSPAIGMPMLSVYPDAIQNHVHDLFVSAVSGGRPSHLRDFVSHTGRHFDVDAYPIQGPGNAHFLMLVAREITEVMRGRRRLESCLSTAIDLARELDRGEVVRRLAEHCMSAINAARITVGRVEAEDIVIDACVDEDGRAIAAGTRWSLTSQPALLRVVTEKRPVVGRVERSSLSAAVWESVSDTREVLTVPMIFDGAVVGTIAASRRSDRRFSEEDMTTLQQLASVGVMAIHNAELLADARRASEVKTDFMNMAAHELRTPLSVIKGYVSMLGDGTFGDVPEAWSEALATIQAKTHELDKLVNDVLTAARLESGRLPTGATLVDLNTLAEAAATRARPRVQMLGAELRVLPSPEAVFVKVLPEHVARIVDNLVNNALTYSASPGWVEIRVGEGPDHARVFVEDHGRGIPEEARERIFDQFVRVEDADFGYPSGTGLGLFISRKLAEIYGGRLTLERSDPGSGSTFSLVLPRAHPRLGVNRD